MGATARTIINNVAVECGLASVNDPYGSIDQNYVLLRTLLNTASDELLRARDWSQFTVEATITGTGVDTSFDVPADYVRVINGTGWNRTSQLPFSAPLTAKEWQAAKANTVTSALNVYWRYVGGAIEFLSAPAASDDLRYEYLSSYWAGTADGHGIGTKTTCSAATDYCLLDTRAITRFLKLKFLRAKNLPSDEANVDYAYAYEAACNVDPARVLDIPGLHGEPHVVDYHNAPDTGYGP